MCISDSDLEAHIQLGANTVVGELAIALLSARELARSIIQQPQGSLWNYGTTPTLMEQLQWRGKVEAAKEILETLS